MPKEDNEATGQVFEVAAAKHDADSSGSDQETVMEQQEQQHKDDGEEQHDVADLGGLERIAADIAAAEHMPVEKEIDAEASEHIVADVGASEHMLLEEAGDGVSSARRRQRKANMLECRCFRSPSRCGTTGSIEGPHCTTWISTRMPRM